MESILANPLAIGVGEIGLDKLKGPSIDVQENLFIKQIEIAYDKNKPIVIHCVRCWDRLLNIRKRFPENLKWAVHGFSGNSELVKQLVSKGFYISFGPSIMRFEEKGNLSIGLVPLNKIFFETDDSILSIDSIYQCASGLLKNSVEKLKDITKENFRHFYGDVL